MKRYASIERRAMRLAQQKKQWVVVGRSTFSTRKKPSLFTFDTKPKKKNLECIQVHCLIDRNGKEIVDNPK